MNPVSQIPSCGVSHIPSRGGFCCIYSLYIMSPIFRHAVVFAVIIHCEAVSHIPSFRGFCNNYSPYILSFRFHHAVVFAEIIHCASCLSDSVMRCLSDSIMRWSLPLLLAALYTTDAGSELTQFTDKSMSFSPHVIPI